MDGNLPPIRYDYGGPRRLRKKKPLPGQAEDNDLVQEDPEPATDAVKLKRLRTDCPGSSFKEDDVIAEEEEHSEGTLEDTAEDNDVFIPEAVLDEQEEESSEDDYDDEMSPKQKKALYEAVVSGDVDLVDDLLTDVLADINMTWYGENLLMAAIRNDRANVAEFLLDNGVDCNFSSCQLDVKDPYMGDIDYYVISCRQMAYERDMMDIVDLIDEKNGNTWPFIKKTPRKVRLRTIVISDDEEEELDEVDDEMEGDVLWEEDEVDTDATDSLLLSDRSQNAVESDISHYANISDTTGHRKSSSRKKSTLSNARRRRSRRQHSTSSAGESFDRKQSSIASAGDPSERNESTSASALVQPDDGEPTVSDREPRRRQSSLSVTSGRHSSRSRASARESRESDVITIASGYETPTSDYGDSLVSTRLDVVSAGQEELAMTPEVETYKNRHLYKGTKASLSRRKVTEIKRELAEAEALHWNQRSKSAGYILDSIGNFSSVNGTSSRPLSATLSIEDLYQTHQSSLSVDQMEFQNHPHHNNTGQYPRPRSRGRIMRRPETAPPFLPLINELEQYDATHNTSTRAYKNAQWEKVQDFHAVSAKLLESKQYEISHKNTVIHHHTHREKTNETGFSNINLPGIHIQPDSNNELTESDSDENNNINRYKYYKKLTSPAGYLRASEA